MEDVNRSACEPLIGRSGWRANRWLGWWIALGIAGPLASLTFIGLGIVFAGGIGTLGNNTSIVWGFPIANYVWWIGIGNAGTLISALLLLTRQPWRASINRFAEAMTLFAASIAGIFPIIHLGRPYFFYWIFPYPNPMNLWPQWKSALIWDGWSLLAYIIFSAVFWYAGLIPDLATLRDRATHPITRRMYGAFALGWRGSARHWAVHQSFYRVMAGLAVPLVCSVHSIVGLDFAASLMPGWQESLFPPYFVVGAMFSGFAMVVLLALLIRHGLRLTNLITRRHFDAMGKVLVAAACVMAASYATEWFMAWYSGERADRSFLHYAFTGHFAPVYIAMFLFNCVTPQVLWWKAMRRNYVVLTLVSIGILVGMWFERITIIVNTLGHGYLPTMWRIAWA
ncbi:MAG: polysulfide reductase NrfD, partial [Caulobacteraceae bacterium]|nr:polysulfide reductase NrfD [Caulobacter sp.]